MTMLANIMIQPVQYSRKLHNGVVIRQYMSHGALQLDKNVGVLSRDDEQLSVTHSSCRLQKKLCKFSSGAS